jgi:hypothetical protein
MLLALAAAGCTERFVDFRVTRLLGLRVVAIDGKGFQARVRCELENPNPLGATVEEALFRVRLGEHSIGRGRLAAPVAVAARSRFELEVPIRVAYADLPPDFPARVQGGLLELVTEAGLGARTTLGRYEMRLVSTGRTRVAESLPVLVQGPFQGEALRVSEISLAGLELRRVRLRIRFVARNLFAFPVGIRRGEFRLDVNDRFFGESRLERPLSLAARGSRSAAVEIAATHGAVASVVTSMFGEEPRFRLRGTTD